VPRVLIQVIAAIADFRTGPSTDYSVIYRAKHGNKILLSGIDATGNWYEFLYAGNPAWITADSNVVTVIEGAVTDLPQIDTPPVPTSDTTSHSTSTPIFTNEIGLPTVTPTLKLKSVFLYADGVAVIRVTLLEDHFTNGSQFNKPRSGFIFLVAKLRVENLAYPDTLITSEYEFKVLDGNGALHGTSYVTEGYDCRLDTVEIFIGGKAEGCTSFEVPIEGSLSIVYAPFAVDQNGKGRSAIFKIRYR